MTAEADAQQEQEWQALYKLIVQTMARWGVDEPFGKGDYLIVDDFYVRHRQMLEVQNLKMFKVEIIKSLQALLKDFPNWEITMAVDVIGKEHWPRMGIAIRSHVIIDDLQRKYLPEEFRFLKIPGSRLGTGYD
jgi:hypothetical protein